MNLFDSRKAQARNYIAIIIILFAFGFISVLTFTIHTDLQIAFANATDNDPIIESTGNKFSGAIRMYDNIIVLIMAVLIIGVGITSFRLNTAPMFFIVTLITAIFTGLVSFFFNFIFIQLVSDSVFTTTLAVFPKTMLICTNLHWIALVAIVVGSITLYGKKPTGQFQGGVGGERIE